ncbi:hypothetical protein HV819_09545 [Anaerococcus sp. AGMB00486]|uniref:Uncharacterized protein n=2 Tax=Anaerococcus TaxID=165779 RepID=A0ABX2NBX7_9FIRM|nr:MULTISPECIES: hypothetical protein [Anaerococcus]MDY3007064.1 hypothetical protein [Anaerococcus porci]MSS78697.1 hypothetical protein [Anaerococcus porci]NVF12197.1 hypothetical protein [Anaerococcus faecalis]
MKNNKLNYQKIAIKLASDSKKTIGFISFDEVESSDIVIKIAKECAKIKNTVYLNFTDMDNYFISDYTTMIKKEDNLARIDISLTEDSSNLINSDEFKKLIFDLKNKFDLILINESKDEAISYLLSAFDDEKILIAYENKTSKSKVVDAKKEFERLGSPIMGVVYNI